ESWLWHRWIRRVERVKMVSLVSFILLFFSQNSMKFNVGSPGPRRRAFGYEYRHEYRQTGCREYGGCAVVNSASTLSRTQGNSEETRSWISAAAARGAAGTQCRLVCPPPAAAP